MGYICVLAAIATVVCGTRGDYWTSWESKGYPNAFGEFELIGAQKPCGNADAKRIQVRKKFGFRGTRVRRKRALVSLSSDHLIKLGPQYGLLCIGFGCSDYKVKYCYLTNGAIQFHKWSEWYDESNPKVFGDNERISKHGSMKDKSDNNLKRIRYGTVTASGSKGSTENTLKLGPKFGLRCLKSEQKGSSNCVDYEVRYRCPGFGGPTDIKNGK